MNQGCARMVVLVTPGVYSLLSRHSPYIRLYEAVKSLVAEQRAALAALAWQGG